MTQKGVLKKSTGPIHRTKTGGEERAGKAVESENFKWEWDGSDGIGVRRADSPTYGKGGPTQWGTVLELHKVINMLICIHAYDD